MILQRYGMKNYKLGDAPIVKRDKFSLSQCLKNDYKEKKMQKIPYVSAIRRLMYAQVCMQPNILYIIGMLGKYLSNPRVDHQKAAKWFLWYLQRTKDCMLIYQTSDKFEIVGYTYSNFTQSKII